MSASEFVLGTAQLGNSYGVNNVVGELDEAAAFGVLDAAVECGVRMLDTAEAYGKSQEVIGSYLRVHPDADLEICTKLSSGVGGESGDDVISRIERQLDILGCERILVYYLHDFAMCEDEVLLSQLVVARDRGLISKVGVSIYEPKELEYLLCERLDYINAVQIPLNVFNCHRWISDGLITRAVDSGFELFARSAYLQGMVFMEPNDPRVVRVGMSEFIAAFQEMARDAGVGIAKLALDFVRYFDEVSRILLGAETPEQVCANAELFRGNSVWNGEMVKGQIEAASLIKDKSADPRYW